MEIIPAENKEEAVYLSEKYGMRNSVYDIKGSLTKLQSSLEAGAGQQGRYRELSSQSEKECEIGWVLRCACASSMFTSEDFAQGEDVITKRKSAVGGESLVGRKPVVEIQFYLLYAIRLVCVESTQQVRVGWHPRS
jgi:hypothetical protein